MQLPANVRAYTLLITNRDDHVHYLQRVPSGTIVIMAILRRRQLAVRWTIDPLAPSSSPITETDLHFGLPAEIV